MSGQLEYDAQHRRLRAEWRTKVNAGLVDCWRCEERITPGSLWDLGHDDEDRSFYRGPEHRRCNRATNGRRAARADERFSREW